MYYSINTILIKGIFHVNQRVLLIKIEYVHLKKIYQTENVTHSFRPNEVEKTIIMSVG